MLVLLMNGKNRVVNRFLATVDRATSVHVVHVGRPGGRPDPVLAHAAVCLLAPFGFRSLCSNEFKKTLSMYFISSYLLSPPTFTLKHYPML